MDHLVQSAILLYVHIQHMHYMYANCHIIDLERLVYYC